MENFSVKTKILLMAGLMLIITCVVAGVGVFANQKAKQSIDDMYNYNLMTTQYLNDANNHLRAIDGDVAFVLQQDFTAENRKMLLDDIDGHLKSIAADIAKVKDIDRSQRAQDTITDLEKNLDMATGKVKASETLSNSTEDKIKVMQNLAATRAIAADLSVLTPDNVM